MQLFKALLLVLTIPSLSFAASSFFEVKSILKNQSPPISINEAEKELSVYLNGELPQYQVNMSSIFGRNSKQLEEDSIRTMTDSSDYYDRLPKLLHSNGVCVTGSWKINATSPYSGAFAANTNNLFIGRVSVAMEKTHFNSRRGFGFAGKLFPTIDPNKVVNTENFFSVDVLMGTKKKYFLETATTNEPEVGFDFGLIRLGLKIAKALSKADENPGFRPLRNLALMNLNGDLKAPKWIRISASKTSKTNSQNDFRDELLQGIEENGGMIFDIHVSNKTNDAKNLKGWKKIGQLEIDEGLVSYGCDRRLHFAHPKLNPN